MDWPRRGVTGAHPRFRRGSPADSVDAMSEHFVAAVDARQRRLAKFMHRTFVMKGLWWLLQFGLMIWLIFFEGANTAHGLVTMQLSPTRMIKIFGFADAGSYLQAAQNLVATNTNSPPWAWVLNLWPPGMVWLDALIQRFAPLAFGSVIGILTSLVWATTLAICTFPFITRVRSVVVVLAAELALLSTSLFQSWMFDEGLFYADGLAAGSFLLGLAIVVNRVRAPSSRVTWIRDGIFAGLAFAAAIYLRASYNLIPWAMCGVALVIVAVAIVRWKRKRSLGDLVNQGVMLVVAAVCIGLVMLPYTAYIYQERGRILFVETENLVYEHAWQNPSKDTIPQWMLDGGSTVGCDIDPPQCAAFEKSKAAGATPTSDQLRNALIKAIVHHPFAFVADRVAPVAKQWFADELASYSHHPANYSSGPVSYAASDNLNPPQGLLYLALVLAAMVSAFRLVARGRWSMIVVPVLFLALLAPFAIVHVEVRYLIPLKLIGFLAPMLILMLGGTPRRRLVSAPVDEASVG